MQELKENIWDISKYILNLHEYILETIKEANKKKLLELPANQHELNSKITNLDNKIIELLEKRQNSNGEIKELVSYLKISYSLLKIGEAGIKFSTKITKHIDEGFLQSKIYKELITLYQYSYDAIQIAFEALQEKIPLEEALEIVCQKEDKTDELFEVIHKDIILENYKEERYIRASIDIFNIVRKLERVADHAVGIVQISKDARE